MKKCIRKRFRLSPRSCANVSYLKSKFPKRQKGGGVDLLSFKFINYFFHSLLNWWLNVLIIQMPYLKQTLLFLSIPVSNLEVKFHEFWHKTIRRELSWKVYTTNVFQPEDNNCYILWQQCLAGEIVRGGLIKRRKWDNIQIEQKEENIMYTTVIDKSLDLKKSPEVMTL